MEGIRHSPMILNLLCTHTWDHLEIFTIYSFLSSIAPRDSDILSLIWLLGCFKTLPGILMYYRVGESLFWMSLFRKWALKS